MMIWDKVLPISSYFIADFSILKVKLDDNNNWWSRSQHCVQPGFSIPREKSSRSKTRQTVTSPRKFINVHARPSATSDPPPTNLPLNVSAVPNSLSSHQWQGRMDHHHHHWQRNNCDAQRRILSMIGVVMNMFMQVWYWSRESRNPQNSLEFLCISRQGLQYHPAIVDFGQCRAYEEDRKSIFFLKACHVVPDGLNE